MGVDIRRPEVEAVPSIRSRFAGSGSLVVFLGRVTHENGVLDLVAVFAIIHASIPTAGLRMVSLGIDSDAVSMFVASLGLD
jgi:hypothetical protein